MSTPTYQIFNFSICEAEQELAFAILYEEGCLGLEELANEQVKAYFEEDVDLKRVKKRLTQISSFVDLGHHLIGLSDVGFKPASYEPFLLCDDVLIRPPPELESIQEISTNDSQYEKIPYPILIKPGLAFGTGRHETTRLVANLFDRFVKKTKDDSVLDVGTGSGILALLAYQRGIRDIAAVEISLEALENARENFLLNHASTIQLYRYLTEVNGSFSVVLGNLLTPTLIHLREKLIDSLKPGGLLILSGITLAEKDQVIQKYSELTLIDSAVIDDWCGLVFRKP